MKDKKNKFNYYIEDEKSSKRLKKNFKKKFAKKEIKYYTNYDIKDIEEYYDMTLD